MAKRKKDKYWYEAQVQDIKRRKRKLTKSISKGDFGADESGKNNDEIKKIKSELKAEKRAAKRAERENWRDEAEEIINNYNLEDDE